jgi:RNA polymerase sigma factor (sigma-70 family)
MRDTYLRLLPNSPGSDPDRRPAALAPAVPKHGSVPADIDRQLGSLGRRARTDSDARNALYAAFRPRLDHWVWRAMRSCSRSSADPAIEPADIQQQAFIVFCDLVLTWNEGGSFSAFVISHFRWRLSDAIRRMSDPRERRSTAGPPSIHLTDGSHAAAESLVLLEALAAQFPGRQATVLLHRLRDGLPWHTIAEQAGVDIRTVQRDWNAMLEVLKASLSGADAVDL